MRPTPPRRLVVAALERAELENGRRLDDDAMHRLLAKIRELQARQAERDRRELRRVK